MRIKKGGGLHKKRYNALNALLKSSFKSHETYLGFAQVPYKLHFKHALDHSSVFLNVLIVPKN